MKNTITLAMLLFSVCLNVQDATKFEYLEKIDLVCRKCYIL